MSDSKNLFSIRGLEFAYGKNRVIRGLNLDIVEGKITTLIGANGCGKTTLFNLMTKNLKPNAGAIELHGAPLDAISAKRYAQQVAIVHQYNTAPDDISVEKLVFYGRTPYQKFSFAQGTNEDEEKVNWALGITQLDSLKDMPVSELSGASGSRWRSHRIRRSSSLMSPLPISMFAISCRS